jgi:hypothetical protein
VKTLISFGEFETMAKIRLGAIVAPYLALLLTANALAQDYSVLRINEVIADNATQNPATRNSSTRTWWRSTTAGTRN